MMVIKYNLVLLNCNLTHYNQKLAKFLTNRLHFVYRLNHYIKLKKRVYNTWQHEYNQIFYWRD